MLEQTDIFTRIESNVRSYCRRFPAVFARAKGAWLTASDGRRYLDLLSGAGSLNYGHNDPAIMGKVVDYVQQDGIVHSLDLHTWAKANFLKVLQEKILQPRGFDYKVQFPGPTGTNAIEASLKLARKVTGRSGIAAFTHGYHGMSLGALAATTNPSARMGAGLPLGHVNFLPYDGYLGSHVDTMDYIEAMLTRPGSGVERPAAVLVELVQGEGGLSVASGMWLNRLARLCKDLGTLLIVDDIQAGCGRTGHFFSFEAFNFAPDIVVLSKSLSGFGSPFSLVLMRPELDIWRPGEHNGTFRGNNLAFVGATAALETYWTSTAFAEGVAQRADLIRDRLSGVVSELAKGTAKVKGRGLMIGLEFSDASMAREISRSLFENGLIVETCGVDDQVLKLLPPLNIEIADLKLGLDAIRRAVLNASVIERALAS
jgi:diaminobutyrate-2-oxoglutarate transaminase